MDDVTKMDVGSVDERSGPVETAPADPSSRLITLAELIAVEDGEGYPCEPGGMSKGVEASLQGLRQSGIQQAGSVSADAFLEEMQRETDAILAELHRDGHP